MGHAIFIVLHLLAVAFGAVLLFVTIPLHLIYAVNRRTAKGVATAQPGPSARTHNHCPDCQEFVLKSANVCRFCGRALQPYAR